MIAALTPCTAGRRPDIAPPFDSWRRHALLTAAPDRGSTLSDVAHLPRLQAALTSP